MISPSSLFLFFLGRGVVQGKSFCLSMHTPDMVVNKVLLVSPLASITCFWRISLCGLVRGTAADMYLPWSVPHRDIHCIWEPLSYSVAKVIYSFVEMVFVFLFLFVIQEQFLKGERSSIFSISLFRAPFLFHYLNTIAIKLASQYADLFFSH